jgi:4-hydroxy-tetrahydrodipicolinate reductase
MSIRIALLGYGKMNQLIEKLAIAQGHSIGLKINSKNRAELKPENLVDIDVAIDFSTPAAAFDHIAFCLKNNLPIVVGTTAWLERLPEATTLAAQHQGALFHSANFSLGVNIFLKINSLLAKLLKQNPDYKVEITEIHHSSKLDAPSGTAIVLGQDWTTAPSRFQNWSLDNKANDYSLPIYALRQPEVVGTHIINAQSDIDTIEIAHKAHSRQGFAQGAIVAALWLQHKKGIFTMDDLLTNP